MSYPATCWFVHISPTERDVDALQWEHRNAAHQFPEPDTPESPKPCTEVKSLCVHRDRAARLPLPLTAQSLIIEMSIYPVWGSPQQIICEQSSRTVYDTKKGVSM